MTGSGVRFNRQAVVAVIAALALGGCGRQRAPGPGDGATTRILEGDSLLAALHAAGRAFGESRTALEQALGRPDTVEEEAVPNRHLPDVADTVITLRYHGLDFAVLRATAMQRDLLLGTALRDSTRPLPGEIRIGLTRREPLEQRLGVPAQVTTAGDTVTLTYLWPPEGAEEEVRLQFVRDALRVVAWGFYVD